MGDLTTNFSRSEFICKHCGEAVIDRNLVTNLQILRNKIGKPINILSAYRCPIYNIAIGGASNSQHPKGKAADITIADLTILEMYVHAECIYTFRNGGIGIYLDRGFIHVDTRDKYARWGQVDNNYISFLTTLQRLGT